MAEALRRANPLAAYRVTTAHPSGKFTSEQNAESPEAAFKQHLNDYPGDLKRGDRVESVHPNPLTGRKHRGVVINSGVMANEGTFNDRKYHVKWADGRLSGPHGRDEFKALSAPTKSRPIYSHISTSGDRTETHRRVYHFGGTQLDDRDSVVRIAGHKVTIAPLGGGTA